MEPNYALISIVFVAALLVIGAISYFLIIFNGLIALKNDVRKAWADIDVVLKQRYDELPNVIAAVKGYMAHEAALFEKVTAARSQYLAATDVHGKLQAENMLLQPLESVFAVAENYPDLKANLNFLELQKRIAGLEIEIADRRELYNATVNVFNMRIESLPDVFVASSLRMKPLELFAATSEEKSKPDVGDLLKTN